jgi:hypothetical protein
MLEVRDHTGISTVKVKYLFSKFKGFLHNVELYRIPMLMVYKSRLKALHVSVRIVCAPTRPPALLGRPPLEEKLE